MEPEMVLWNAVLAQAIRDTVMLLKKVRKNPSLWANPLFLSEVRQIKRFFHSRSMEPGGFGFICTLLDLDPGHAASRIEQQYLKHLSSPACGQGAD
ncbi:MAG: hypothetical protein HQL74_13140 [Magnetococcales bacterium]|nr:hypothetical protein [Magnetococcales bacterium]